MFLVQPEIERFVNCQRIDCYISLHPMQVNEIIIHTRLNIYYFTHMYRLVFIIKHLFDVDSSVEKYIRRISFDSRSQFKEGNHFLLKDVGFMWSGEFDVGMLLSPRKHVQIENCNWELWLNRNVNVNYKNWNENKTLECKSNERTENK